jgi:hypothetical protein
MNAKRSTDGIAKFVWAELILAWKNLDSFRQTGASFYGYFQAKRKIIDVDAALSREQWLVREDPEVGATTGLFERRFDAVPPQLPLQLEKIV